MAEARRPGDDSDEDTSTWEDYDVAIFYKTDDLYRVEKTILNYLNQANIRWVCPGLTADFGSIEYINTAEAIRKSKKTLLILSGRADCKSMEFSLETYLALEQCLQTGRLSLMVLLIDSLSSRDLPEIPFLQQATQMNLVDNYHERCMETVCKALKREVQLNQILPAGNFAVGMAWSHFAGYLKQILPDLAQKIQKSDVFQNNLGKMSTVFFMLCPLSARGRKNIEDADPDVKQVGSIEWEKNGRKYSPTVYKVKGKNEKGIEEEYLCCAEYPNALCALSLIAEEALNLLTPKQRRTEVERFKYRLEEILNHSRNTECIGRARVLMFDDEGKGRSNTPSSVLFTAVRSAIEETMLRPLSDKLESPLAHQQGSRRSVDVCFLYSDPKEGESSEGPTKNPDDKTIHKIRTFLEGKKVRCSIARPPVDDPVVIEERVQEARWVCCLLSRHSIKEKRFIEFWLAALLNKCIEENHLKIVILLKDIDSSYIPNFIRWVTYIDITNEPSFEERIFDIIKGEVVSLRSQVPAGNVAFGLAWAFHVNYLRHVLPDFDERLNQRMEEDDIRKLKVVKESRISRYFLQIIPKSCNFKPLLNMVDDRISEPFFLKPVVKQISGTERTFTCKLYRIEGEKYDYYFAGEMLTPVNALSEMHKSMIAGLSKNQMYEQCDALVEQLVAILDSKATPDEMQNKCRCIKFNDLDTSRRLADVIMGEIDKERDTDHVTNYGGWLRRQGDENI